MTFSSPGVKQVTLEVCKENSQGTFCDTVTKNVTVLDPKPAIVSVGSVPSVVGSGQQVALSAYATGRPNLGYKWVLTSGQNTVQINGAQAMWDTKPVPLGTWEARVEVANGDGVVVSTPITMNLVRMSFSDVPPNHWAWNSIEAFYNSGITSGCATGPLRYCPTNSVTRAEMAVFLERAMRGAGFTPIMPTGVFSDVAPDFWAAGYIEQFFLDGITTGCGLAPLRFCPTVALTRAEMAIFLLRAKHGAAYLPPPATGTVFADVPAGAFGAAWIEQLAAEGVTSGCATNPLRFCPGENVSRDQMATFIVRAFSIPNP
ncbi:MAG TPA: S-layer homology domain-containing protein [Myxococcota bacterium]|nr:S-layer homology domain-containing protein [Myxococcota bacterium]